jgi:release factor glutamine methyltransferase
MPQVLKYAWRDAAEKLKNAGVKTPILDARLLLQEVLQVSYETLLISAMRELNSEEEEKFNSFIARRVARQPVAIILEKKEFWSLNFKTTKDTLDPRPDSEVIIFAITKFFPDKDKEHKILDLGTGTGCLLLTLLNEYPFAKGEGVDISPDALKVALYNSKFHTLDSRARFYQSSWTENVEGKFDIIISNPPYIKTKHIDQLEDEVRLYDPMLALDGGDDGLDEYRKIVPQLEKIMTPSAQVFFEIGKWQEKPVKDLIKSHGFKIKQVVRDYAGIPRVIHFYKPHLKILKN